jgi:2-keto-4-pentenoate hydratase
MRAVAYAVPAVEIVDSAVADWNIRLVDTIADNASAGGFALGTSPRRITDVDMRLGGAILSRNGQPQSMGLGAACLGHPLNATLWLARKMASLGRPMDAGDIVLSGALGPIVPVAAGDVLAIEIQGFEPFQIGFAG